jgi:hypothetical protein
MTVLNVKERQAGDVTVLDLKGPVRIDEGQDFSGLYRLSKVYLKRQEHWQIVASRTARLGSS